MISELAKEIVKKKEFSTLDLSFVEEKIYKELAKNPKLKQKVENAKEFEKFKKTAACKELIKSIRTLLREIYGVFQNNPKKQEKLTEELLNATEQNQIKRLIIDILQTHQSTKERFIHYPLIYKKIQEHVPSMQRILDIGCGLNPLSFIFLEYKPHIYATDISTKDMQNLHDMLNKMNIPNTCFPADITQLTKENITQKTDNQHFDICFMLKVLDTLESNEKYASIRLLQKINSKYILLSFPKFSLGGKRDIGKTKRAWVQKLVNKLPILSIKSEFETPNEIFYLLEQHDSIQTQ